MPDTEEAQQHLHRSSRTTLECMGHTSSSIRTWIDNRTESGISAQTEETDHHGIDSSKVIETNIDGYKHPTLWRSKPKYDSLKRGIFQSTNMLLCSLRSESIVEAEWYSFDELISQLEKPSSTAEPYPLRVRKVKLLLTNSCQLCEEPSTPYLLRSLQPEKLRLAQTDARNPINSHSL
jgi:hypothetical protein